MAREYSAKTDAYGNVMVSRQFDGTPKAAKWYRITPLDLFAALQALETMRVFDTKERPGHITDLFFSGDDIETIRRFTDGRSESPADQGGS